MSACVRKWATYIYSVMGLIRALNYDWGHSYFGEVRLGHSFILATLSYVIANRPHEYVRYCTQFMDRVILIIGG